MRVKDPYAPGRRRKRGSRRTSPTRALTASLRSGEASGLTLIQAASMNRSGFLSTLISAVQLSPCGASGCDAIGRARLARHTPGMS